MFGGLPVEVLAALRLLFMLDLLVNPAQLPLNFNTLFLQLQDRLIVVHGVRYLPVQGMQLVLLQLLVLQEKVLELCMHFPRNAEHAVHLLRVFALQLGYGLALLSERGAAKAPVEALIAVHV